jgi:hypothetical protein
MRFATKILSSTSILLFAFSVASAKAWRGIVPLHSSRQDVVRLLNQCEDKKERCSFSLEDQDVMIVFSGWQHAFNTCPKSIPRDTVLLVRVRRNRGIPVQDLKVNLKTFKAFDPSYPSRIGYRAYIDEKSGLLIKAYKGDVVEFDYIAAREDQAFCPRFYESPRDFVSVVQRGCCPTIMVACRQADSSAGSRVTFLASTTEDYESLIWTVTEGKILSGQGTREITVDTAGVDGRKITATVEMKLEDYPHSYTASCAVQISGKLPN